MNTESISKLAALNKLDEILDEDFVSSVSIEKGFTGEYGITLHYGATFRTHSHFSGDNIWHAMDRVYRFVQEYKKTVKHEDTSHLG